MATSTELRAGLAALATRADGDLTRVWRQVTTAELARDALAEVLPTLIDTYGTASGALAADWYDELREQDLVTGRFRAIPAPPAGGATELARWGTGPLFAADPDWASARTLVAGGLQRRIANTARETVMGSSVADPGADGWQRVARAGGCDWCLMLASRGAVYTEDTVDFGAHDHCNCTATAAWSGQERPVKPYVPSLRQSKADQQRAKEWIRKNVPGAG